MMDLSKIKNKKLRKLIEESERFSMLPKKEQEKQIDEMAKVSSKMQDKLFCPFFEEENEKEKLQQKALMRLMLEIDEMDKRITKLEKEDREKYDEQQEKREQEKLLKELETV